MAGARTLSLARPCCYARFVFAVAPGVPVQTYSRHCAPCGITWAVRRETIGADVVADRIEWLDMSSRAFVRRVELG